MAAVLQSAVTLITTSQIGDRAGKLIHTRSRFSIVLSAQGATAGDITAALLGYADMFSTNVTRFDTTNPCDTQVSSQTDGTNIYLFGVSSATAATNVAPANQTGTLYIEVHGRSL